MNGFSLDTDLRARLETRRGDWPRIAAQSGISHSWLSQFARNKIPNPGFATLRKLAECLDGIDGAQVPADPAEQQAAA